MNKTVKIDNWYYPVMGGMIGTITGHPNPDVGRSLHSLTSRVVGRLNGKVVTESGTMYELGEPDKRCEFIGTSLLELLDEMVWDDVWRLRGVGLNEHQKVYFMK